MVQNTGGNYTTISVTHFTQILALQIPTHLEFMGCMRCNIKYRHTYLHTQINAERVGF